MAERLSRVLAACVVLIAILASPSERLFAQARGGGTPPPGHGHGGARSGLGYDPPPDSAEPNNELPSGTVRIQIRNADQQAVAGAPVELHVLHTSVAKGDSTETHKATADDNGFASFTGLMVGGAHQYRVRSRLGDASYRGPEFQLGRDAGVDAVLHVFDASPDFEESKVFTLRSSVEVSFKEDVLVVRYAGTLANPTPIAWLADYHLLLPAGFTAFQTPDGMEPAMIPTETGARLKGTVPPGVTEIGFLFHVPMERDGDQSFEIGALPRTIFLHVNSEASKKMSLQVAGMPEAKRQRDRSGKSFLVTEKKFIPTHAGDFIPKVRIQLAGLPKRETGPWIAIGLVVLAAASAGAYLWQRRGESDRLPADSAKDLLDARETLVAEIIALERARLRGDVGPRAYARIRQAMLDALARIIDQLDAALATTGGATATQVEPAPAPADVAEPAPRKKKRAKGSHPRGRSQPKEEADGDELRAEVRAPEPRDGSDPVGSA
jgi:hypothetical protein